MQRSFSRADRLSAEIQRLFNSHLRLTIQNPTLKQSSITEIVVSKDLVSLTVYFTLSDSNSTKDVESEFNRSKGHFKKLIADNLRMRRIPEVRFVYDKQREQADRITELLSTL